MDEFVKALINLGPAGIIAAIMFWFLWEERRERRYWQEMVVQIIKDKIASDNVLANGLERLSDKLGVK